MPSMPTKRTPKIEEPVIEPVIEPEYEEEPVQPVEEDTVTFKRSHFYLVMTVLAFATGVLLGYVVWGMGLTVNAPVDAQNPQTAAQVAVPVETLAPTSEPQYVRYDVPAEGFHTLGPDDAPITLIEFSDYQCPFCRRWQQEVYQPLLAAYPGKIKLVYRNLPLTSIHPDALPAAEAAMCAGDQNAYWQYHDKLFGSETLGTDVYKQYAQELGLDMTAFDDCITNHKFQQAIQDDSDFAINLGVRSTPTFFVNGLAIVGAQPLDVFKQVIDKELAGEIPK